jgi:ABC-type Zn2+ transport system substrate-binding protein/surface adhesin
MKNHTTTTFWGGDNKGTCIQITTSKPVKIKSTSIEQINEEGFIQLTMEDAANLCTILNSFIIKEAKRRQALLKKELEQVKTKNKSVFHEVSELSENLFEVSNLAVKMVSNFCPKS